MSLRLKTILGVALIEAVLLAILLTLTLNYLRTTNFDGLNQRAFSTSDLFASTVKSAVLSYDLATVESFTQELLRNEDIVYVAVFGEGGQVLSSVGSVPSDREPSRLEGGSHQVTDGVFDVSSPITEAGIEFGAVWLGFDMSALNDAIDSAKKWSTLIVAGEMTLVALFSYVLGAYLTQRLSELRRPQTTSRPELGMSTFALRVETNLPRYRAPSLTWSPKSKCPKIKLSAIITSWRKPTRH